MKTFTYFIQVAEGGLIKIGRTDDPYKRFRHIQTCSPVKLTVLRLVNGDREHETLVHRLFRNNRVRGEWFDPVPALLNYIESLEDCRACAENGKCLVCGESVTYDHIAECNIPDIQIGPNYNPKTWVTQRRTVADRHGVSLDEYEHLERSVIILRKDGLRHRQVAKKLSISEYEAERIWNTYKRRVERIKKMEVPSE